MYFVTGTALRVFRAFAMAVWVLAVAGGAVVTIRTHNKK